MKKLLITCPPMQRSIDRYYKLLSTSGFEATCPETTQILTEDELIELLPRFDAWIIGDDPATERVFEAGVSGKLRAAVKWGVGVDNIDFDGAAKHGLIISNTPGMFGDEVADLAMHYVTGLARDTFNLDAGVKSGEWPKPVGSSLKDKTVAVVGFGSIGKETSDRLLAAKMRVNAYDPRFTSADSTEDHVRFLNWPEEIQHADFIVLCCALVPETQKIIDERYSQNARMVFASSTFLAAP